MSADFFAGWKKEEETFSGSNGGGNFDASSANNYKSPYRGAGSAVGRAGNVDGFGGSNGRDDFDFETLGDNLGAKGAKEDERSMFKLREHGLKVSRRKGFTLSCMSMASCIFI